MLVQARFSSGWWRFSFVVLAATSLWFIDGRSGLHAAIPQADSLSCASAYQIGEWSWKKTPSEKPSSLTQDAFAQKVLSRYLDIADPHKLLLLKPETEAFFSEGKKYWKRFIQKQDCGGFESWLTANLKKGSTRLKRLIAAGSIEKKLQAPLPKEGNEDKGYPWFGTYAKEEADLSQRVEKFAIAIAETASAPQLEAFNGNKKALMEFSFDRVVFADGPVAPVHVLARAFVSALDPFSDYFSESEYSEFYRDLVGGTSGIGVKVREIPTGLLVQKVVPQTPAGKSKAITSGDRIIAVNGEILEGMPSLKIRHVLEGPEYSEVVLTLAARQGRPQKTVRLVRRSFAFEDSQVESRIVQLKSQPDANVAVIEIPSFYGRGGSGAPGERSSAEDVATALNKVLKSKPVAVVLDLRGNPGGYLEEAVTMAGLFLGNRPVVAVVEPLTHRLLRDFHARPVYNGPLLVFVDDQSASASEVLAGALKDYQRAVVLGHTNTYGKGSVQRLFHLDSGLLSISDQDRQGVLKLTTSFFYSPLGHSPADGGITPHLSVGSTPPKKDFRPHRKQLVPSEGPFVDGATLSAIKLDERLMESRIAFLKESQAARPQDVTQVFQKAVLQAFGTGKSEERDERVSLAESIAIAEDLAGLEKASQRGGVRTARKTEETALH